MKEHIPSSFDDISWKAKPLLGQGTGNILNNIAAAFCTLSIEDWENPEYVITFAAYLSVGCDSREEKVNTLKAVMEALSPKEARWQTRDAIVEDTLEFITQKATAEWDLLDVHTESLLIWELRAISISFLEIQEQRIARIERAADGAAVLISAVAKLTEAGMVRSASALSQRIDGVAARLKKDMSVSKNPLIAERELAHLLICTDTLKRISAGALCSSKNAVNCLQDISGQSIHHISKRLENSNLCDRVSIEQKEALKAIGKVSLVTFGAATIIGEATMETSQSVLSKTAVVTTDIVKYRYGDSAGKLAYDAGEAAMNCAGTFKNIAILSSGTATANITARKKAKEQTNAETERALEIIKDMEQRVSRLFHLRVSDNRTITALLK